MSIERKKFPESPRSHEVGVRVEKVFGFYSPDNWIIWNACPIDYGWDLSLSIKENQCVRGDDFFVQLKGSDSPKYIKNNTIISISIGIKTINFLLDKSIPSMICVCDTGKTNEEQRIHWIWLQDFIDRIEEKKPTWEEQGTINVHIPVSQSFDKGTHLEIETYVRNHHADLKIKKAIGDVIGKGYELNSPEILSKYRDNPNGFVLRKINPSFKEAGIIDTIYENDNEHTVALSVDDRKKWRKLADSSKALNELRYIDAEIILNGLEKDIENSSDCIKARYFNNKGVLALHLIDKRSSLENFNIACTLNPRPTYLTNLLLVQFIQAKEYNPSQLILSDHWKHQLNILLSKDPNNPQAIRLKAAWLAKTKSVLNAEHFLKKSVIWDKEPIKTRLCLAEIYLGAGDIDAAENLLDELYKSKEYQKKFNVSFWEFYGDILLQKAIGKQNQFDNTIHGYGPNDLDTQRLYLSEEIYNKAYEIFKSKGLPPIAEHMIINYIVVLNLLGKYDEAERICRDYLDKYPKCYRIQEDLALCLVNKNKSIQAIPYAQSAFDADQICPNRYNTLLLSLVTAEEYEKLHNLILKREEQGFFDRSEKVYSYSIDAIALNEIGRQDDSQKRIDILKSDKDSAPQAVFSETDIAQQNGESENKIINIYNDAILRFPNNIQIKRQLLFYIPCATKDNANEIIEHAKSISKKDQLSPKEFWLYSTAYLVQEKLEEANEILKKAIIRYQNNIRLLYVQAIILFELGYEESAFEILKQLIAKGERNYSIYKNIAFFAIEIGSTDEAVKFLQKALSKAINNKEKGKIHCQLYELKKRQKDTPKNVLRHAIQFGKTISDKDIEQEALFLMMCLTTPPIQKSSLDEESKKWLKEINKRLTKFSKTYPKHPLFMTFNIPKDIPENEKMFYFLTDIMAWVTLPKKLATANFRIDIRSKPYPLVNRAQLLYEYRSIFDFWNKCILSKEFAYAIHILSDLNSLEIEKAEQFLNILIFSY